MTLRQGMDWVEIRPLQDGLGLVREGSVYAAGDLVARPKAFSWEEASEIDSGGGSVVGPTELALVYDAVDDAYLFEEGGSMGERLAVEDARADLATRLADDRLDQEADLAREIARALAADAGAARRAGDRGRRQYDEAA